MFGSDILRCLLITRLSVLLLPDSFKTVEDDADNVSASHRSRKYIALSDEEIIQYALKKGLDQQDQAYLSREVDYRGLGDELKKKKNEQTRALYQKPIWQILGLTLLAAYALSRQMGNLF
jgi:hypothetical protein